ncbi:MAG: serine--tRNA ligase [Oscillospiraceae bacterium]|jgi:seryl-tRNA synthetase|nr:serine--tRNA ligase [Oscillospiraceae bacterium]
MLDIKEFRENPQKVKAAMRSRNKDMDDLVDEMIAVDERRRSVLTQLDALRNEQNEASRSIPKIKKEGGDVSEIFIKMGKIKDKVKEMEEELSTLESRQNEIMYEFPNMPSQSVPEGKNESDNVEVRRHGEPRAFDFEPKAHWDLGEQLSILDPQTAAKVTGARFTFYKGLGARLERAIINLYLDTHTQNGYTEILPPFIVNRASMTGTGQLPKFEEDAFKTGEDFFLVPTAEVPLTNMYRDEILNGNDLPLSYCAYSACFRAEAGSAGRDTRGLIRQHQFNKVELVKFARPDESYDQLEKLTADAERVLKLLDLPYRVISLCTGDLGVSSAKTYDIEVWMPSYNRYVEISSCSNCEDFQARRAGIRFKMNSKEKAQVVHTLTGSGVAAGRTTAAILENCQNEDGSISVPKALVPYMGTDIIA